LYFVVQKIQSLKQQFVIVIFQISFMARFPSIGLYAASILEEHIRKKGYSTQLLKDYKENKICVPKKLTQAVVVPISILKNYYTFALHVFTENKLNLELCGLCFSVYFIHTKYISNFSLLYKIIVQIFEERKH